jgi:hypothetical protein
MPQRHSSVIDLGDSDPDDDHGYVPKSRNDKAALDSELARSDHKQHMAVRPSKPPPVEIKDDGDDEEEDEDDLDPALAALRARARARVAAARTQASTANGDAPKAPITQLLIDPQIPGASPLMVKVRIDTTIEKVRLAWCEREKFSPEMIRNVFFTWKGTRLYDSTSIKRLGIKVDDNGNLSVEGDDSIYDDDNLPKIHVEAWTQEIYKQWKKEQAADAVARKIAAATPVAAKEKTPTPEPEPEPASNRVRLILKAKGKPDFKLTVKQVCLDCPFAVCKSVRPGLPQSFSVY